MTEKPTYKELEQRVLDLEKKVFKLRRAENTMKESEQRYEEIFKHSFDCIYLHDFEGNFLDANPASLDLFGYTKEEITFLNFASLLDEDELLKAFNSLNEIIENGVQKDFTEYKVKNKNGGYVSVETKGKVIYRKGKPYGIMGAARNITKRKQAEIELQQSEERYRSLVENTLDGYFICEIPSTKFIFLNQRACDIFGYSRQEGMDLKVLDVISSEDHERVVKRVQKRLEGKKLSSERQIYTAVCKDGSTFKTEISTSLVTFQGESAVQGVLRDITEQERLEQQLQQAHKMEAIGTLAGGIAHDFNNLLMGILGYKSLLEAKIDTSHLGYEHLAGIEKCVESATELTKRLLGFARKGKYEVKPTNLNELIKDQNHIFSHTKKEITIHSKYEKNLWTAEVDRGQIEQVLMNIYVNAWQAMPDGGELHIQTENVKIGDNDKQPFHVTQGKYVKISVTDIGAGMDEETRQRIFDPFFTTKEKEMGTGMGLSSAYGIIKNHEGFIEVDSEPGVGSTFNIYLPASRKKIKKDKKTTGKTTGKIKKGSGTILLIDDEQVILDVGKDMLKVLGYNVLTANGGNEGLEIFKKYQDKIDMVILDMIMPGTTGSDVYDNLKEINPDIKVLLSSGYSLNGKANEILERGCNGFIQKPFNMEQFSQKISEILSKQ